MKTSDKLYNINATISLHWIALNRKVNKDELIQLNTQLGEIIKEIRTLEDYINTGKVM